MSSKFKKYHGQIDLNSFNNSHTQTFFFLHEHIENYKITSPRILEIGCSGGYFSSTLKDHGYYVYGVEPFTDEAFKEGLVDDFFYGSVEDFCTKPDSNIYHSFDAIILGDVLEHLLDPENTLIKLTAFLNPIGVIIASIPNITHIGIQRMISDRQWMYQKYGILDSTHLRFFSWTSINELFIKAGLGINRKYNVLMPEFKVYPSAESAITFSNNSPLNPELHTLQFVIRASKNSLPQKAYIDTYPKNILIISRNPGSSLTILRLIKPLHAFISTFNGKISVLQDIECQKYHLTWADVIIAHRDLSIHTLEIIREARKLGTPVIYDIDDLLTQIPEWSQGRINQTENTLIEHVISTANLVTCTSKHLQNELKKFSDNVKIVPNVLIQKKSNLENTQKHHSTECTLILASSDTVVVDFIINPLKQLCQEFPSIKIVTIGQISYALKGISSQLTEYKYCQPDEFSSILNSIKNGIGLIPLDNSLFSSCKSSIKYFHYTSCGIVTIASNVKPYSDDIKNGENGILVDNTTECWLNSIKKLINDSKLRQLILIKAIRTWQNYGSKETAIHAWKQAFYGLPKPTLKC